MINQFYFIYKIQQAIELEKDQNELNQVINPNDCFNLKNSFNGSELNLSLIYYIDGKVLQYSNIFTQQCINQQIKKIYGSWENFYINCFEKNKNYQISTQGLNKVIQIPLKSSNLTKKDQHEKEPKFFKFVLKQTKLTPEIQCNKLKRIIDIKGIQKQKLNEQIQKLFKKLTKKDEQIKNRISQLQQMQDLCSQGGIPLFIKNRDYEMIQRCKDPHQFLYRPAKIDAKHAILLIKNKIKQQSSFTVTFRFESRMRNENHAIGIVAIKDENKIEKSLAKLVYELKGQMIYGMSRIPCQDVKLAKYSQIHMKIDYKQDTIQFKKGNEVFASAHLSTFETNEIRPFVKIGLHNIKYRLTIS